METDNKYYTPTIEEIYNSPEIVLENGTKISPFIYRKDNLIIDLPKEVNINNFRVKYLDKEDIESLGWQLEFYDLSSGNKIEIFRLNSFIITSYSVLNAKGLTIDISTSGLNRIFRGKVKNKSEFKKLMLQLGIIN